MIQLQKQVQIKVHGNYQYTDKEYEKGDELKRAIIKEITPSELYHDLPFARLSNVNILIMLGEAIVKKNGKKLIVKQYRMSVIPERLNKKFDRNSKDDMEELWHYDTAGGRLQRELGRSRVV